MSNTRRSIKTSYNIQIIEILSSFTLEKLTKNYLAHYMSWVVTMLKKECGTIILKA
jgi:hypothetical protein